MTYDPFRYRTRFLILTLLAIKPSHGYELSKRIEDLTGGHIKASSGSVYPLLRELKEQGLVSEDTIVEQGRLRKVYRITRKGAQALLQEINIFYNITNQLLSIVVEARKSLEKFVDTAQEQCPPRHVVEGLKRLRDAIDNYIRLVEEKISKCRTNQQDRDE